MVSDGRSTPYPLRSRLARHLRQLRDDSRLTIGAVGRRLGWSGSKLSRIETSLTGITPEDTARLLDVYRVSGPRREALLALAVANHETAGRYRHLEAKAATVLSHELTLIPGIVQTPEYVRAMTRSNEPDALPEMVEALVASRLARQSLLTMEDGPTFHLVMDETVLHRPIAEERVMRGQMRHLITSADLPGITLQVLPFEVTARPLPSGAFSVLRFKDGLDAGIVAVENHLNMFYFDEADEVERYVSTFDCLSNRALDPDDTIRLVERLATGR
ncbi:transcriptional regulator [Longispora fulva]|uniref:Transcriptional regulator with XRE-family HTH domain n=1 Tax=Longispora fulva TaxID=619741 RepID=A0A8J7KNX1_9ACTN|nr:helix-turn-helix transcriptional regulator [Longispora fulva]MBG6140721.1 transcriptional regulator with XRE-family HTH domain [Longispora fulva]GIG61015.1 transcriptional regulator [Longispora fulva]